MITLYGSNATFTRRKPVAEATSPWRNLAAFNPSNECSKCPWIHANTLTRAVVIHTLRCHFIITTELSKIALPTRFSNWRNSKSSSPAKRCQRLTRPTQKIFSSVFLVVGRLAKSSVSSLRSGCLKRVCIISVESRAATTPKISRFRARLHLP